METSPRPASLLQRAHDRVGATTVAVLGALTLLVVLVELGSTLRPFGFSLAAVLAMPLGAGILFWADPVVLTRTVSGIVLAFVVVLLAGWRYAGAKRLPITLGLGAISGGMMATTAVGGPPVLVYMLSGPDKAATNRANIIMYFGLTGIVLLAVMAWNGLAAPASIARALLLTPVFWGFSYTGQRLFRKSGEQLYRRVAYLFLAAIGLYGLFH